MTTALAEKKEAKDLKLDTPLFSFVVPIYNIKPEVLKRCLLSLQDQDYEPIEVICVLDGPNKELENVARSFLLSSSASFRIYEIEHSGACAARNFGFEKSKGDIVSFFNSDYIAKPGMVSNWVDIMTKKKEFGFIYGGYEYATTQRQWYPSRKFDPWLLEVANYIDCGFPLWRKYVVRWDNNCKSLQDWDFWLRVIKTHNVKGFYLGRELSYLAEAPRPNGLSMDSSNNWKDRVNYVKKNHKITNKDIVVTSLGAANHGIEIAKLLDADFRDDTIYKPSDYKALYMVGFYMRPTDQYNEHPKILSHFQKDVKKIVHFVGADIYWLRKFPFESLKYLTGALKLSVDHILCENEIAQKELREFGIESEIVPIPPYSNFEVRPLPAEFRVATLLTSKSDFDKYCFEPTLSIIRAMPDIQFASYGDGDSDINYPNLKCYGELERKDYEKFVYDNSCLLRLTRHDTMPMASNEFIMAGRNVITNIPAKFMNVIDTSGKHELNEWDIFGEGLNAYNWPNTKTKIVQSIRAVRDMQKSSSNIYQEAHDFYADLLDKEKYINKIRSLCGI